MMEEPDLFTPLSIGKLTLPNRILMAPMTRGRADAHGSPTKPMETYYSDRADSGLLISEGICVSPAARGWTGAPGLYEPAHIAGWQRITDAVHANGGRIFAQLWYLGRVSHPVFLSGATPWAPSPIAANGHVHAPDGTLVSCVTPHEMSIENIQSVISDFAVAAKSAIEAGFDGVQIHGANGYLPDQFLRDKTNHRSDEYGGSARNRSRLILEIAEACCLAIGAERVSVRLSTRNQYNDIDDSDPATTFGTVSKGLAQFGLSFLEVVEGLPGNFLYVPGEPLLGDLKRSFGGVLVANAGYDGASATAAIRRGDADAVSFGVPYLANPDLVERLKTGAPLNAADPETFYSPGEPGYLTYPRLSKVVPPADKQRQFSLEEASRH